MLAESYGKLIVAIDASGSIDKELLNQFAGELSGIVSEVKAEIKVIYHDYDITNIEDFSYSDMPLKLNPKGGGGTRFSPVFNYVRENELMPAGLIYFTDLECNDYPDIPPGYPVLWICYNKYSEPDKPPFGELIRIKSNE
jgi:predicted metal-dependent peptidase